jgi:Raf kinase inhibitor-like YbhB/YbcL family protein
MLVSMLVMAACSTGAGRTLDPPVFPPPGTVAPETTPAPEPVVPEPMLVSAAWPDGAEIPVRYTCRGDDVAPALSWANVPPDAVELAVTVVDLDAAGFVHWIVYGIDPQVTGLVENELPPPGLEWVNSFGAPTWGGPCPPVGQPHLYQFTVHALNQPLEVADDAPATEVISMLNLIAIDQGAVTGTFVRTE